jgi:predicted acetyltransferase
LQQLDAQTHLALGNAGDHARVLQLLVQAFQYPLAEDFQSRLDEPSYQPIDRLLLEREGQLIGHVQVSKQIGWFQGLRLPLVLLQDFVTLPEYRAADYDAALLRVAESTGLDEGGLLALVRTDQPEWFEQNGWSICRGQGHTQANTRAILSHFDAQNGQRRRARSIEVQSWRHYQLDVLENLYQQLVCNSWGGLQRSLETWQWLVGRKAQDQVLIAVERVRNQPSNPLRIEEPDSAQEQPLRVVGYAMVRDSCIVEMLTLPGYAQARAQLVVRACRDAIDRDHHHVSLHTPAADPMHELLVTAGGSWITDSPQHGGQWMLKLLSPERWIEKFYPVLHERAREAGIARPLEISFSVGQHGYRLGLTRRSSRLEHDSEQAAPQANCDWRTFQDLLTSNLRFPETIAQGQLQTTHASVAATLATLFPPKLLWQSPLPMLRL